MYRAFSFLNDCLQFADVNAFLTLAATFNTLDADFVKSHPSIAAIVDAAHGDAGRVPVKLVCSV